MQSSNAHWPLVKPVCVFLSFVRLDCTSSHIFIDAVSFVYSLYPSRTYYSEYESEQRRRGDIPEEKPKPQPTFVDTSNMTDEQLARKEQVYAEIIL